MYQAGTLSGNPLATAAGLAVLDLLDDGVYEELEPPRPPALADGLGEALGGAGVPVDVPVVGPLLGLHFSATPAVDYDTARTTDEAAYARFFHALLAQGVALAPGAYEVAFPGLAHDDPVIDQILTAADKAAQPHRLT